MAFCPDVLNFYYIIFLCSKAYRHRNRRARGPNPPDFIYIGIRFFVMQNNSVTSWCPPQPSYILLSSKVYAIHDVAN